jgi:hypothetical protein
MNGRIEAPGEDVSKFASLRRLGVLRGRKASARTGGQEECAYD